MDTLKTNLPNIKFNFFGMRGKQPIWANEFNNNIKIAIWAYVFKENLF